MAEDSIIPDYIAYIFEPSLWVRMIPSLACALILAVAILLLFRRKGDMQLTFVVVFSMTLLGVVAGVTTGQSRAPAVGAVVPAILSLTSALMVYIIAGKDTKHQKATSVVLIGFTLAFFIGIHFGSAARHNREDILSSEAYLMNQAIIEQNLALEKIKFEAQRAQVRAALNLPLSSPKEK